MPRIFRPKGGTFSIRIDDDGNSYELTSAGERQLYSIGRGNVSIPTWNVTELENLIKGGSWEEVTADAPKPAPAVQIKKETKPIPAPAPMPAFNEPNEKQE